MKKVLLFVLIFVLANQFAQSWVKGGLGNGYLIFNPENDKDLVTMTKIDNQNSIFYIDIENMKANKLPIVNEFALAISEKNNILITGVPGFSNSNFALYNYKTGERIFYFNQSGEIGNPNTSPYEQFLFCIDSTGKYFFSFNKNSLTLITYDIYEKKTVETHVFDLNSSTIQRSLFMPGKNAICFINNDGTAQFFSLFGTHESNFPNVILSLNGQDVMTFENDHYFSWLVDNKKICLHKTDPNADPTYIITNRPTDNYSFTKGMKFCFYNHGSGTDLYNIQQKQIWPISNFSQQSIKTFFWDSAITKSIIGYHIDYSWTFNSTTYPDASVLHLVDVTEQRVVNSVPEGFVPSPYEMILNKDGSLVFANSTGGYYPPGDVPLTGALVRVQDSTFLGYLRSSIKLFTFSQDSKYLASSDSNSIYLTNTQTGKNDIIIASENRLKRKVVFSSDNKQMYNVYANGIDVYDYPSMNLVKSIPYLQNQILDIVDVKWLNNGMTILAKDQIWWYGTESDMLIYSGIPRIGNKMRAIELSPKGDYVLLYSKISSLDSFLVMNTLTKEIVYKYTHIAYAQPFELHFFGSYQRLVYSYEDNGGGMFSTFLSGVNLETGVEKNLIGMHRAYMHPNGTGYFSAIDYKYYYTDLPSELIVGVKDNRPMESSLEISPNPAGDFITIKMGAINPMLQHGVDEYPEIFIYNTLGEKVMTVEQTFLSVQQINISDLPKGMYFVRIESETGKFVKM